MKRIKTALKWAGIAVINVSMIGSFLIGSLFSVPALQLAGLACALFGLPLIVKLLERGGA